MSEQGPFASQARKLGKSARTRAKLMDAATGIFAREGFEAASVNRIAHAADVVNGTFYLHFKDKDDIAAAVAYSIAAEAVRQLDAAIAGMDDAIERVAMGTRRFVEFAAARPEWGLALFRATWHFPQLRQQVIAYVRADLERGARQGVFTAETDDFTVDMFASMTLAAAFGRLQGLHGDAGARTAELQLRMLGVAAAKARKAAAKPLPPFEIAVT
jgi:AcrR family transcriptional regulator